jgi:hypothetical protein
MTHQRQVVEVIGQQHERSRVPVLGREKRQDAGEFRLTQVDLVARPEPGRRGENVAEAKSPAQIDGVFAGGGGRQDRVDLTVGDLA